MKRNFLIVLLVVIFDQVTKYFVATKMSIGESITIIDKYLYITSHRNTGAAWGILAGKQWFFYIVTVFAVVYIVRYLYKNRDCNKILELGLLLYLAGAVGNFIDRVLFGEVVDFVNPIIPIIDYNFPIFNIADMSLVCGFGLILISILKESSNEKRV